jgi:hypothetical protein
LIFKLKGFIIEVYWPSRDGGEGFLLPFRGKKDVTIMTTTGITPAHAAAGIIIFKRATPVDGFGERCYNNSCQSNPIPFTPECGVCP